MPSSASSWRAGLAPSPSIASRVTTRSRSAPPELCLALLHEGSAALDVVLAGEAFRDQPLRERDITLRRILEQLGHRSLDLGDRERRVLGDRLRVVVHEGLELALCHHLVDQAHDQRLLCRELLGGEE